MDKTDDIRAAIRRAREAGNAAKLRVALEFLNSTEHPEAVAIIGDVLRSMEPPVAANPT